MLETYFTVERFVLLCRQRTAMLTHVASVAAAMVTRVVASLAAFPGVVVTVVTAAVVAGLTVPTCVPFYAQSLMF